jgi:hypothetical protein
VDPKNMRRKRILLETDGIKVENGKVDLEKHLFRA